MLKNLILLLVLPCTLFAGEKSLNDATVVTHIHYLYKKIKDKGQTVQVRGPQLSKKVGINEETSEKFSWKNRKFEITKKELEFEKTLANSAFVATGNDATGVGTAVYIGGDYVLTNLHVYNREYKTPSCKKFSVKTNPDLGSKRFSCKKLIKCNKELDYCLIEVKAPKGKSLSDFMTPPAINLNLHNEGIVRLIGNIKGNGFQASAGDGIRLKGKRYLHQAPLFKGASGGPLFNNSGELIGVNFAETKVLRGSKAYNFATPLHFIKEDLEKSVSQEVLDQLLL